MREVTLSDGGTMRVRPLTCKEVDDGADLGFGPIQLKPARDMANEVVLYALGTQFASDKLALLPNPDRLKIYSAIIAETYGVKEEEKNSSMSGPGARTKNETNAAGSADDGTP